jgi:hypothetical protein
VVAVDVGVRRERVWRVARARLRSRTQTSLVTAVKSDPQITRDKPVDRDPLADLDH